MDSEYSIQERKAIPTTKTGLSDDLVSSIESCSPLPLGYVRNVCADGRNTIFIKPLARNVCQIIMIKSWRKVSFREKESKKEKLFQNHFLRILIYYHKPKWRRFVFLLYVYCTRCFFSMKCNTEAHQYLSAIRQYERGEVLLLILIVAMKNTICFKPETSGRSIKPGQALSQNGPILRLKLSKFLLRRFEVYYSFPMQTVQHRGCCYAWTTIY